MKECLVTRLKGSVDDTSLLRMNEIRLKVEANAVSSISVTPLDNSRKTQYEIVGNGYFTNDEGTENYGKGIYTPESWGINFSAGNFDIAILDKFNIRGLMIGGAAAINIEDLRYCSSIESISSYVYWTKSVGDISAFEKMMNLKTVILIGSSSSAYITGDVSVFSNKLALESIVLTAQRNIVGNIANLGNSPKIETISVANTSVSGSIEGLVSNLRLAKGVEGSIKFPYPKTCAFVTYQGTPISTQDISNTGNTILKWTGTTISFE